MNRSDYERAARLYGIDPAGLTDNLLIEALEQAGQCGACETVQAVLYGMDYPVVLPAR